MPGKGIYQTAKVLSKIVSESDEWFIGDFCLITVPKLVLGHRVQVNAGSKILGRETVAIGSGSVVSYDVLILTSSDSPNPLKWKHNDFEPEEVRHVKSEPITIGANCFIGAKSVLMPGVEILDNTVIPAGSYVTIHSVHPLGEKN